jgi:predicted metalloprotease with PDZ domain
MTSSAHFLVSVEPEVHEFVIRLTLSEPGTAPLELSLPAWIPGSYMVRDFARNVTELVATDDSGRLPVQKTDKQTWSVEHRSGDLQIDYRVYALDLSVRSAFLDDTRGFFNGTSLFLKPNVDVQQWRVTLVRPQSRTTRHWSVHTTLPAVACDEQGFGDYEAPDYGQLIDHPVELGDMDVGDFSVGTVPHRIAISDGGRFDMGRLCRDVGRVCAEHVALFDELPVDQYLFLTLATADGYGGLEHRDSTSLVCKRADLPALGTDKKDKGYRNFLGLCSHEYFHLWNVKRIKPEVFLDPDLSAEQYTELLWAFEGITSYYDDLALARSGVVEDKDYLDTFATTVTRVMRGAGRLRQSIAESSFDAWTRFYKQDENAPNAIVSYYAKGALVAFGLDVTLRRQSNDTLCLDDLMRRLWSRYGKRGIGIAERGIEREAADLLGAPLGQFFNDYVYGTVELPLDDWFATVGVGFRLRPTMNADDNGGCRKTTAGDESSSAYVGARWQVESGSLQLSHVLASSPAQRAGLSPGDVLVAIDAEQVTASNVAELLQRKLGTKVRVHYFRRGLLLQTDLEIIVAPADTCELWLLEPSELAADVVERRKAWLSSCQPEKQ